MQDLLAPIDLIRPATIAFGAGRVAAVGSWVEARGCARPLVVADAFNAARIDLLALPGRVAVFAAPDREPEIADLEAALGAAAQAKPDLVVGFGGGSAMDLAKLVAALHGSGQSLPEVVGPDRVRGRACALVQVATTAGTGSEAGHRSLIADPVARTKFAVQSHHLLADLAVVDPELTLSVPPRVTAATGVDALAHCVEAHTSRRAHPLIDLYALEGIRLVGRFLTRAIADGGDREARAGLALAALYGGFCLGPVNTTAGHAVAYPLGTRHHVPHGAANALIFPHTLAFNAPAAPERTTAILQALGQPAVSGEDAVRAAAAAWCAGLPLQMRLSALGVPETDLPAMAEEAHAIRRLLDNNPRDIGHDEILAIYRRAF